MTLLSNSIINNRSIKLFEVYTFSNEIEALDIGYFNQ
jgi:hypothetical protein